MCDSIGFCIFGLKKYKVSLLQEGGAKDVGSFLVVKAGFDTE